MPKGVHGNHVKGAAHYNYKGGRSISSHGYVKIQVGTDHHLADQVHATDLLFPEGLA